MRKFLRAALAFLLVLMLQGCGTPAEPKQAPAAEQSAANQVAVNFTDPVLEKMVRETLGIPQGEISAAAAESVTRLNLSGEWRQYLPDEQPIHDITGLERFTNLESLDLSFQDVSDISPLKGLTKLKSLALGGDPVADIAPLSGLTNLRALVLSDCAAQDYSPLANLNDLAFLKLDGSAIADVSPLTSLANLKGLFLADCPAADLSPLSDIYENLAEKDFTIVSMLSEIGFHMNDGGNQAYYNGQNVSVRINRSEWGAAPVEWETNCVWMSLQLESGYTLDVGFYVLIDAYVFQMVKDGQMLMNYIYDLANGGLPLSSNDRSNAEDVLRAVLGEKDGGDILLSPIPIFEDTIQNTFGMSASALFALPFAPPTLKNLGFSLNESEACYQYSRHDPHDMHISIYRPEWGVRDDGDDMEFYDDDVNGYHLLILYDADTGGYHVALFGDEGDCAFDVYPATDKKGVEYPDPETVQQMFQAAFGTTGDEFYRAPLTYMDQVFADHFRMSSDELFALPSGE